AREGGARGPGAGGRAAAQRAGVLVDAVLGEGDGAERVERVRDVVGRRVVVQRQAVLAAPALEDRRRRRVDEAGVVQRRAADSPALEDRDGLVRGRAQAGLLVQQRQHAQLALVEVRGGGEAAGLERDDIEAARCEAVERG